MKPGSFQLSVLCCGLTLFMCFTSFVFSSFLYKRGLKWAIQGVRRCFQKLGNRLQIIYLTLSAWAMRTDTHFLYIRNKTCSNYAENIRRHLTKFIPPDDEASRICAPLILGFIGAFAKLRKAALTVVMPVCPSVRTEHVGPSGRIFMKFVIFRKYVEKIQVSLRPHKNNGYFT
jgi:hypothetical protein